MLLNREQAQTLWPIIKAFGEGKTIQTFHNNQWSDLVYDKLLNLQTEYKYRMKPDPKVYYKIYFSINRDDQSSIDNYYVFNSLDLANERISMLQVEKDRYFNIRLFKITEEEI